MIDTLPKLGNELPNTDEPERVAASLIVDFYRPSRGLQPDVPMVGRTQLKPVWAVDFYRGRPEQR